MCLFCSWSIEVLALFTVCLGLGDDMVTDIRVARSLMTNWIYFQFM